VTVVPLLQGAKDRVANHEVCNPCTAAVGLAADRGGHLYKGGRCNTRTGPLCHWHTETWYMLQLSLIMSSFELHGNYIVEYALGC